MGRRAGMSVDSSFLSKNDSLNSMILIIVSTSILVELPRSKHSFELTLVTCVGHILLIKGHKLT